MKREKIKQKQKKTKKKHECWKHKRKSNTLLAGCALREETGQPSCPHDETGDGGHNLSAFCKSLLHHVVEHCLPLLGLLRNGISLTSSFPASHSRTTTLRKRPISSCGHDGGPVSSRRARPARSVLDFSLCFQHSCLFFLFFVFVFFAFVLFFRSSSLPFLFSFFIFFYFSFSCLSSRFLPLGTHMASRQIHRAPKVVLFSFFFSSKPIKWLELPWKCTQFSKLSDDRPWSWNRR